MGVIDTLHAAGLKLKAAGEQLIVEPRLALTDALRALIRQNKDEILSALAPAPSAPSGPCGRIFLVPGPHVIDGRTVEVPRNGDQDRVWFAIEPGRREIDGKVVIVPDPRHRVPRG